MKRGHGHSAETRARMSAAHTGLKHSPETRAKIAEINRSPGRRAKMSAIMRGNQHTLGHKHSAETRAKMSAAKRAMSAETRAKMSAAARRRWAARRDPGNVSPPTPIVQNARDPNHGMCDNI